VGAGWHCVEEQGGPVAVRVPVASGWVSCPLSAISRVAAGCWPQGLIVGVNLCW
jgi:hypothetical protein